MVVNVVGFCFLIELEFLNPRKILKDYDVFSLIKYDSE
jgi:adenine/guanine phosphoribosyltransferase-like PRPP-binding protein